MQQLKDIVPAAQNNINTLFILLDKSTTKTEGEIKSTCVALVADETATVHFQLWGEECDAFDSGDILRLTAGIFSYKKSNSLLLRAGKRGIITKVGEFTMIYVESPNLSEACWKLDPENPSRYVQDGFVSPYSRVFPPRL